MIYIQYSFKILYPEWRKLLYKSGALTVRGGIMDALFIGSLSTFDDHDHIIDSGFDGFYTFSAKNGHTYGSTFSSFRFFYFEIQIRLEKSFFPIGILKSLLRFIP